MGRNLEAATETNLPEIVERRVGLRRGRGGGQSNFPSEGMMASQPRRETPGACAGFGSFLAVQALASSWAGPPSPRLTSKNPCCLTQKPQQRGKRKGREVGRMQRRNGRRGRGRKEKRKVRKGNLERKEDAERGRKRGGRLLLCLLDPFPTIFGRLIFTTSLLSFNAQLWTWQRKKKEAFMKTLYVVASTFSPFFTYSPEKSQGMVRKMRSFCFGSKSKRK